MPLRVAVGLSLLAGVLLLVLSCSRPLMRGGSPSDDQRRSREYFVQLDAARQKAKANQILGNALTWWNQRSDTLSSRLRTASSNSPVTVAWRAPPYRIRIGPFASQAQADPVLNAAQSTFPGAFVHPDQRSPRQ